MASVRTRNASKVVEVEVHQEENGGELISEEQNGGNEIQEVPIVEKPKKTGKKKATPKKKAAPRQQAPKPKEIRDFMQNQAEINASILEQLRQLNQSDKCGQTSIAKGSGGQAGSISIERKGKKRMKKQYGKTVYADNVTESSSESESEDSDYDNESIVRRDISEANALLQARFTKTTGKHKSAKRIERDIKSGRPFAYLDREVQRQLNKENCHPEELTLIHHVEGLIGMVSARCVEPKIKGMVGHIHQILRDCQVHNWSKIRKWSNETLVKTATEEWQWSDNDNITQARNSHYMIQSLQETEEILPCPAFNKGQCVYDTSHFSTIGMLAHVCAFCFALEGMGEGHQSKGCGKRRSSSNYFRHKDDGAQQFKKEKGKHKNFHRESVDDKGSKN